MSGWRVAFGVIAAFLACAEFAQPTHFTAKKIGRASQNAIARGVPLDREALDDLPPIVTPAIGNVDAAFVVRDGRATRLSPGDVLRSHDALLLVGWCGDPEAQSAAAVLLAIVDDVRRIDVSANYHTPRPDVVRVLGRPGLANSGFSVRLQASDLGTGMHVVRLAVVSSDGRGLFVFPTPTTVTVALH